MGKVRLKVGVLGLDEQVRGLMEAARRLGGFEIEAVGGRDAELSEKVAGEYGCGVYRDLRLLVTENEFDWLLVGECIHGMEGHIRTAMKKGCDVLKVWPAGRGFEEAAGFAGLARQSGVRYGVVCPWRYGGSEEELGVFMGREQPGDPLMVSAVCHAGGRVYPRWQNDPELAGGGVLLYQCYQAVDRIVSNFGMPAQVYCLRTNMAGDKQQRYYLTEDIAVVTMRFSESCCATVTGSKVFGPAEESLKVYFKERVVTLGGGRFDVCDAQGQQLDRRQCCDGDGERMERVLQDFASDSGESSEGRLRSSGLGHLNTMAVIESAYVSARTGMPEEPRKLFETVLQGKGSLGVIKGLWAEGIFDGGERKQ